MGGGYVSNAGVYLVNLVFGLYIFAVLLRFVLQLVRADFVGPNAVTTPEQLIGKSARRVLLSGKPLNTSDIREPRLVRRNSMVVMTYRTSNLMITAHGKARENGTAGETIQVQNANSGKVVDAVVTGPDTVAVLPMTQSVAQCAKCR